MSEILEQLRVDLEYALLQLRQHKCISRALDALDRMLDRVLQSEAANQAPPPSAEDLLAACIDSFERDRAQRKGGDA